MQIKTKRYNLTAKEFRRLIRTDYFKKMKWTLIIIIVLILFNLFSSLLLLDDQIPWFVFLLLAGLFYLTIIPFMINVKGQSKLNFMNRYCEIDENFFTVFYEDGSIVKLKFDHISKAVKGTDYYFFYLNKNQFHYLPLSALETEQDIHRLDLFLAGKQLVKLW